MSPPAAHPNVSSTWFNHLISVAAMFEGSFSIDWVQELTQTKASQVLMAFEKAVRQGLMKRDQIGSFAFSDPDKRRNWQDQLSPSEKRRFHGLIASTLIAELPESEKKAESLAPHLLHISNDLKGCNWLMKAGENHQSSYRIEEAIRCYSKILDDLSGHFEEGTDQLFCDAAIKYSKLSTAKHDTKRVLSIIQEALMRSKEQKNYKYQSILEMHFAKNKWLQSQYKSALKHFEQAWAIAKDLGDEKTLRSVTTFNTFFLYWQGRFKDAVREYERSVPDVEKHPHGRFPLLASMTVGTCYGEIGQVTQGLGMIDSVRSLCIERGDTGLAAHSGTCIGAILLDIGRIDESLKHLEPAVEEARRVHRDWTMIQGELILAYAYYLKGQTKQCMEYLRQYCDHSTQVNVSVRSWPYLMELCWAIKEGRLPALHDISIEDEIRKTLRGKNLCLKGVAHRFKALLEKKERVPPEKIMRTLERSIELLEASGQRIELAKSRFELARIHLMLGDRKQGLKAAQNASKLLYSLNESLIPNDLKPLLKSSSPMDNLLKDILKMNRELATLKNGKDRIQHIISTVNCITGAERGAIFLLENGPVRPVLRLRASKNLTSEQVEQASFKSSLKVIMQVATQGEGQVLGLRPQEDAAPPYEDVIRSQICVPIITGNQVIGALYHDNRLLSNAFYESQLELLACFATFAALTLENAEAEEKNRMLKEKVRELKSYYEDKKEETQSIQFMGLVGESPQVRRVMTQVAQVARSDATVLILGETGVGKEVVARSIHMNSPRRHKPFIPVSCSALSESLIHSELFGHEKGAFTGADRRRAGRFEKANEGTLFLDEIGDLPLDIQVRLLRVLERKEFERVGGTDTIRSDFRLIAATNRDLEDAVKKKRFRDDLFYRINVFRIYIPPLRERKEDISLLVDHFLRVVSQNRGKMLRRIPKNEMRVLTWYDWPGNVRELKNVIERWAISGDGTHAEISSFLDFRLEEPSTPQPPITMKENERRHILRSLEKTKWKVHGAGGAAELLDIHPNTLAFRMKKLGIARPKIR